jgi:hypothetical protein
MNNTTIITTSLLQTRCTISDIQLNKSGEPSPSSEELSHCHSKDCCQVLSNTCQESQHTIDCHQSWDWKQTAAVLKLSHNEPKIRVS